MDDPSFLIFLLLILIIAFLVLLSKYNRQQAMYNELQATMNDRIRQSFNKWRTQELQSARSQIIQVIKGKAEIAVKQWKSENEANIRADAIRRSSSVVSGKVTEHLAPFMNSFPYNPKDVRFLGAPIDLIIFDGLNEETLREIIFLEVKYGNSTLTTRERRIRDIIFEKKLSWKEFRVNETN